MARIRAKLPARKRGYCLRCLSAYRLRKVGFINFGKIMAQNSNPSHLSAAQAKNYVRKIAFIAILIFAVLIAGVFYLVNIIKEPAAPVPSPTMTATATTTATDGLTLAKPRSAYDLPVTQRENNPALRMTIGSVTAVVPRHDIMSNGSARQNLYARTDFFVAEKNRNCYFHQYMGLEAVYKVGNTVNVQYDPNAPDFCGTGRIVK